MYLKKIIAHGFKSFADKINLDFNDGLIGIVGPNGSGKSNVVDAIRWVLGEQSVKSLRGDGNMTDVIFSGSKSRNPLNVASVTLIFDNKDHYFKLDYNEISIKRRVYRDGSNEYYINGERCRLKDINDILIDTGVAKESFNIISQGKIEEILSSKPSERRIMFEEAAGVLKYKRRKEEALRKLEKTHENMDRVNDIINEIDKQLEPLKEQTIKTNKYIEIKNELENMEISLITNDITNINNKYQEAKEKIEILNNEILKLSINNSGSSSKIEEYKLNITKINNELSTKQKEFIELATKVEQINSQKKILLERKKYQVEDTKLHNNIVDLKEQELKLNNNIKASRLEVETKVQELNEIIKKQEKINQNITESKNNKNKLESDLTLKVRTNNNLKIQIENLKDSIENNSLLPSAVRSILNNIKLKGIHNTIGNILEIDEKYVLAISTSLGFSINNIIVEDEVCAKEAVNYLKNNNIGRATFFPLSVIKKKEIDINFLNTLKDTLGFVDVASNLVKYDKKYENIILNQLGNVIVASNIDAANKISRIINQKYKIVTLDGQIINVGGSITGGKVQTNRNNINEKYELEEKIKNYNTINFEISELENKINDNDYTLKSFEDEIYLINRDKINLEEYVKSKNSIIKDLEIKLEEITREIEGTNNILNNKLTDEENNILKSYYDTLNAKESLSKEIEILEKKRNNLNDELEEYEHNVKMENSLYNSKNKELKQLEIESNRYDVKLDTLLNTLNETYSITYEKAVKEYILEIDAEVARNRVVNLKHSLNEIGNVNLDAPSEYEKINERYTFLDNQRKDLSNAEDTLLKIIEELDDVMARDFKDTFEIISKNFSDTFRELFRGGNAELRLTDASNLLETGIEIVASPPGKKLTSISLLSGGEKTFTAISLLFAILKSRPVPFCILDEVEAALDEVNVESFGKYLKGLQEKTQFILITHKKKTMEYVDLLYGITMQESGVSKIVSVKLEEIE